MLFLRGGGSFANDIVGESYYQRWIERVVGGRTRESARFETTAVLVPEDDNRHDENAVRVDIAGGTVGHLSREIAPIYRVWLLVTYGHVQPATCPALIVGGWDRGEGDFGYFGVKLDLPDFVDSAFNVELAEEPRPRRSRKTKAAPPRRSARRSRGGGGSGGVWAGITIGCLASAAAVLLGCCGLYVIGSKAKSTEPTTPVPTSTR